MSVRYDKAAVDSFVSWMTTFFDQHPQDLIRFWEVLAFSEQSQPAPKPIAYERFAQWGALSLWERQAVFFALIPVLERTVADVAKQYAARARIEEPL